MTVSTPTVTWLVIGVSAPFGQWLTMFARDIPPGMALEKIATAGATAPYSRAAYSRLLAVILGSVP
jgi:hypothetical protein